MSDDGRLRPAWGPRPQAPPDASSPLAGLFAEPVGPPPPAPPDPALLAAQYQAQQEATAPPRAGGTHRARRQPARYIIPAIIGALAVVALVVGLSGWFRDTGTGAPAAQGSSQVSVPTATVTSPAPRTPTPTPTPSVTKPAPTPTPTPPPKTAAPPPVVHAPAVVLNETSQTGLAGRVAAQLRAKGWTVTGIGNWRGNVSATTVYYPPGMAAAARSLAYDLGIGRIRPQVAGMLTDRLTVVLTSNPYS